VQSLPGPKEKSRSEDWWEQWVKFHLEMFGLTTSQGAREMLSLWRRIFAGEFTLAQMRKASEHVAATNPPKFLGDHLRALKDAIKDLRRISADQRARKQEQEARDRGVCTACGNSGLVFVPHLRSFDEDGNWKHPDTWVRYQMVVSCGCFAGRKYRLQEGRFLTVEEYEKVVPNWAAVMREARRRDQADSAVEAETRAHSAFGLVVERILERARQRSDDTHEPRRPEPGEPLRGDAYEGAQPADAGGGGLAVAGDPDAVG
jgi:hypothetical protein